MLVELVVENFAVVEKLRLRLYPGLNVLTGETGSGKSLVVGALGLLFGGRASSESIRTGAGRACVSGIFALPSDPALAGLLNQAGVEAEDGELLIERELLPGGKSRAFAASRPVTAAFLKDLAPYLGDIHGQHDQQKLFSPDSQRDLLDEAAGSPESLDALRGAWDAWRAAVREMEDLDRAEQEKLRMADLWTMQRREIESAGLATGEDARLENDRRVLKNVARLSESATAAYEALSESEESVSAGLGIALKRLEELARIDESLAPLASGLKPAQIAVQEAAHELRHYLGRLEADPARLEGIETRLAQIEKLRRKYGTTIEEILAFLAEVRGRLEAVESAGARRAALEAAIAQLHTAYRDAAGARSTVRRKTARKLEKQVEAELAGLAMKGSVFRIAVEPGEPGPCGADDVTFLVSANVGEEPRPLEKVASGGELSRIALALRTCVTPRPRPGAPRTLVFDEVDSGVGGAAAETVGRRLKKISASGQVLCVTHLAQIAAFGGHHFVVSKRESGGRTLTEVEEIDAQGRVGEIARMLSGARLTDEALRHAASMLEQYAGPA
jgi:DNA repair protein RecN (Recombination protein N)